MNRDMFCDSYNGIILENDKTEVSDDQRTYNTGGGADSMVEFKEKGQSW